MVGERIVFGCVIVFVKISTRIYDLSYYLWVWFREEAFLGEVCDECKKKERLMIEIVSQFENSKVDVGRRVCYSCFKRFM